MVHHALLRSHTQLVQRTRGQQLHVNKCRQNRRLLHPPYCISPRALRKETPIQHLLEHCVNLSANVEDALSGCIGTAASVLQKQLCMGQQQAQLGDAGAYLLRLVWGCGVVGKPVTLTQEPLAIWGTLWLPSGCDLYYLLNVV